MTFKDLCTQHGFVDERNGTKNREAVVKATEKYVAENGPAYLSQLCAELAELTGNRGCAGYFTPERFSRSGVKRASVAELLEELYGEVDEIDYVSDTLGRGTHQKVLYIQRKDALKFVRDRVSGVKLTYTE